MRSRQGQNFRLYSLTNYYLSGLAKGIQTAHTISEMIALYQCEGNDFDSIQSRVIRNWSLDDKTIIVLNGGNSADLESHYLFLQECQKMGMYYPYAKFNEDEQSLGGAATAVGIILPEHIYELSAKMRSLRALPGIRDQFICEPERGPDGLMYCITHVLTGTEVYKSEFQFYEAHINLAMFMKDFSLASN